MTDFVARLVARALGTAPVVQPRAMPRFAQESMGFLEAAIEVDASRPEPAGWPPHPASGPVPGAIRTPPVFDAPPPPIGQLTGPGDPPPLPGAARDGRPAEPFRATPATEEPPVLRPTLPVAPDAAATAPVPASAGPPAARPTPAQLRTPALTERPVPAKTVQPPLPARPDPVPQMGQIPSDGDPAPAMDRVPAHSPTVATQASPASALQTAPGQSAEQSGPEPAPSPVVIEIGSIEFRSAAPAPPPSARPPPPAPSLSLESYLDRQDGRRSSRR